MQYWADYIVDTDESSFWKRQLVVDELEGEAD